MFKFKPEDFDDLVDALMADVIKTRANHLLQAHLATLPMVKGWKDSADWDTDFDDNTYPKPTHTALLWGITEIEKKECEHEPIYLVLGILMGEGKYIKKCKHCGVKLKARWEPEGPTNYKRGCD